MAFVEDISERRRVEQSRTDFVANISHELKTPVGALSVLAETLVDETDLDTIGRVVARMLAESDRASNTIDDLMELSRIEVGSERSVEPVKISDVIHGGVERASELAAQLEITISTLAPVDGPATQAEQLVVTGDRRQLVSAVGNLVENAVKYSEAGSSVQVRARSSDGWVEVSVVDQGVGIPQRDLDRVFERFYRVDRARSRTTGGTGLGLSIVRHVATNHGGEVVVSSVEGEGSTFVLRLPIDSEQVATGPTCRYVRRSRVSQPTVFVVEDEASFVEALQIGLTREGFRVEVATDGMEAIERFAQVKPDLVLLDVMLPRVSGIDVCRHIRSQSSVPIIMVTAKSSEIDTVVGLEVGADDYVTKPYRIRELVARIRALLRRAGGDTTGEIERSNTSTLRVGDVTLDPDEHRLTVRGEEVTVPLKEFEVLQLLLANAGRVLTREVLIDRVWGSDYVGDTKTLDVHIKRLRAKIEPDPSSPTRIVTIRGLGYKYERAVTSPGS